jgi:hypothetical protein
MDWIYWIGNGSLAIGPGGVASTRQSDSDLLPPGRR